MKNFFSNTIMAAVLIVVASLSSIVLYFIGAFMVNNFLLTYKQIDPIGDFQLGFVLLSLFWL